MQKQAEAWKNLAANEKFAGLTLAEFEALVGDVQSRRLALVSLVTEQRAAIKKRREAEATARTMSKRLYSAIKSHPDHGEDSALLRACGFKAESEYRRTRRRDGSSIQGQNPATEA